MRATWMSVLFTVATAGCLDRPITELQPNGDHVEQKLIPVSLNRELDLLFVIDNSGSMAQEHAALETRFPELISALAESLGTLPDLHIGVVSSDMGTGAVDTGDARCNGSDRGRMHGASCPALSGASFLTDVVGPNGDRLRNYTGALGDAFACAADLGVDGCGFEQHLASMKAALSPGINPGFLRESASLGVIFLADEDDCSAEDDRIFARGTDPVLGPFSDFRCYEQGVVCDNDPDPRAPGVKTGCVPRTSPYLHEVTEYADFLRSLKQDEDKIFVGAIVGDPDRVAVGRTNNLPVVEFACSGAFGDAAPAVRIAGLLGEFAATSVRETICTGDLGAALRHIGENLPPPDGVCFTAAVQDVNPERDGVQADCSIVEIVGLGGPNREERPLPQCATGSTRPCWKITADPVTCADSEHHLRIDVERDTPAPAGGYLDVQCVVSIPVPPPV